MKGPYLATRSLLKECDIGGFDIFPVLFIVIMETVTLPIFPLMNWLYGDV